MAFISIRLDILPAVAVRNESAPPEVWRALGHDLRWRLLTELSRTDQRVNELVEGVGEPQNLVSYHLGVLKRARVVSERRSSADGRDIYYHLDLERLGSELGGAAATLHPTLRPNTPSAGAEHDSHRGAPRVLFLCTGNSARSLIAEAIVRERWAGVLQAFSAGPRPAGVHPLTLEVLRDAGIDIQSLRSKGLDEVADLEFDYVITLCDIAREECPPLPGNPEYMHWSLPDPAAVTGTLDKRRAAFRSTVSELTERIGQLVQLIAATHPAKKSLVGGRHR